MRYKYTIKNVRYEPHDVDEEIIFFYFNVHFTDPEEQTVSGLLPLRNLLNYVENANPALYKYIKETEYSLDLWGAAEKSTLEAIGTEAVEQLYGYLKAYLIETDYASFEFERLEKIKKNVSFGEPASHNLREVFGELEITSEELKKSERLYRQFCQTVERRIRQTAMEVYPEIADLEPEELLKFKHLFVNDIINMHNSIKDLLKQGD